jgi:hypothetical protein
VDVPDVDLVELQALHRERGPDRLPLRSAIGEVLMGVDARVERLRLPDVDHHPALDQDVDA